VERIATGDVSAFEAMFRAYKNDLGAFVESYVRSRAVAEELIQELFLSIWEQRYSWRIATPLNTYLFRAARNRAISHLRHERVEARFRERLLRDDPADAVVPLPLADEVLAARDLEDAIEQAVRRLPARCEEIFRLNRYHHLSYAEVADVLGLSVKTVEVQMGRALAALRRTLAAWPR
jgi:RNA polymerase sigma-70 factor (ECF subfamily)